MESLQLPEKKGEERFCVSVSMHPHPCLHANSAQGERDQEDGTFEGKCEPSGAAGPLHMNLQGVNFQRYECVSGSSKGCQVSVKLQLAPSPPAESPSAPPPPPPQANQPGLASSGPSLHGGLREQLSVGPGLPEAWIHLWAQSHSTQRTIPGAFLLTPVLCPLKLYPRG